MDNLMRLHTNALDALHNLAQQNAKAAEERQSDNHQFFMEVARNSHQIDMELVSRLPARRPSRRRVR